MYTFPIICFIDCRFVVPTRTSSAVGLLPVSIPHGEGHAASTAADLEVLDLMKKNKIEKPVADRTLHNEVGLLLHVPFHKWQRTCY